MRSGSGRHPYHREVGDSCQKCSIARSSLLYKFINLYYSSCLKIETDPLQSTFLICLILLIFTINLALIFFEKPLFINIGEFSAI